MRNISRSKDNKIMKFGQLIECNMRNMFIEKSHTKCGEETSPRRYSEKLKLSITSINNLKLHTVCFYCMEN